MSREGISSRLTSGRSMSWQRLGGWLLIHCQNVERQSFRCMSNCTMVCRVSKMLTSRERLEIRRTWESACAKLLVIAKERFNTYLPTNLERYQFYPCTLPLEEEETLCIARLKSLVHDWDELQASRDCTLARDTIVHLWFEQYVRLGELGIRRFKKLASRRGPRVGCELARSRSAGEAFQAALSTELERLSKAKRDTNISFLDII